MGELITPPILDIQNHIDKVIIACNEGDESQVRDLLYQWETRDTPGLTRSRGSGNTPSVKLKDELTWSQFALGRAQTHSPLRILDLGTGSDAACWTYPYDEKIDGDIATKPDEQAKAFRTSRIDTELWLHSRYGVYLPETKGRTISYRTLGGHFIDVLNHLKTMQIEFDLVLSRYALYHSRFALETLLLIDDILAPGGVAFLDEVGRGPAYNYTSLSRCLPSSPESQRNISFYPLSRNELRLGLNYAQARVGGLFWHIDDRGHESVAFEKGSLNRDLMPSFAGAGMILEDWTKYRAFDGLRSVYRVW